MLTSNIFSILQMGDRSSMNVKRLKLNTTAIYPDFTQKTTKTELFTGSENSTNIASQYVPDIPPPIEDFAIRPSYQERILQNELAWDNARNELLNVYFESLTPFKGHNCAQCCEEIDEEEHVRCKDCGGVTFFCSIKCLLVTHNGNQLFLHKPKLWKVSCFLLCLLVFPL